MTPLLSIHPTHPQPRLLQQVENCLEADGVVVLPTDSAYALCCQMGSKLGIERIRKIRQLDPQHHFTLMCSNLSQLSQYTRFDTVQFRLLKAYTPGPYTFILNATKEVPKIMQHPKRRTIGFRIPDNLIVQNLLKSFDAPIMSVTLILPNDKEPLVEIDDIQEQLDKQVDLIVDGGFCGVLQTSVIDLTSSLPVIIRIGKGDVSALS